MKSGLKDMAFSLLKVPSDRSSECRDEKRTESRFRKVYAEQLWIRSNHCPDEKGTERGS